MQLRIDLGDERAQMELLREPAGIEVAHRRRLDFRRIDLRVLDRLPPRFRDQIADRFAFLLQVALKVSSAAAEDVNRFHNRSYLEGSKRALGPVRQHGAKSSKLQIPNPKEAPSFKLQKLF